MYQEYKPLDKITKLAKSEMCVEKPSVYGHFPICWKIIEKLETLQTRNFTGLTLYRFLTYQTGNIFEKAYNRCKKRIDW